MFRYVFVDIGIFFNFDSFICVVVSDIVVILICDIEKCFKGWGEENIILVCSCERGVVIGS